MQEQRHPILMDGRGLAAEIRQDMAARVAARGVGVRPPCLAVIQVGDVAASNIYVRSKRKACQEVGFQSIGISLEAEASQAELEERILHLNEDSGVDGILLQLPLPRHLDVDRLLALIDPAKDVDGFHPLNMGRLVLGRPGLAACTPRGILTLLHHYKVPLAGRRAVILGRSAIVGKPLAAMLLNADATVTIAHSRTEGLAQLAAEAEVLVAAVGRAEFVTPAMVHPGATVVDVGINRLEDGRIVGDVRADVARVAGMISPVPGGIGPMTIASLLENTWESFRSRHLAR